MAETVVTIDTKDGDSFIRVNNGQWKENKPGGKAISSIDGVLKEKRNMGRGWKKQLEKIKSKRGDK